MSFMYREVEKWTQKAERNPNRDVSHVLDLVTKGSETDSGENINRNNWRILNVEAHIKVLGRRIGKICCKA